MKTARGTAYPNQIILPVGSELMTEGFVPARSTSSAGMNSAARTERRLTTFGACEMKRMTILSGLFVVLALSPRLTAQADVRPVNGFDRQILLEVAGWLGAQPAGLAPPVVGNLQVLAPAGGLKSIGNAARGRLPLSGLAPSKLSPDLCLLKYRVSTESVDCQAFVDQGLGYFYSYVWMEAVRSFESAAQHDPQCAMAWWGLSRSLERYGKAAEGNLALEKADALKDRASFHEQQLILARMQEKGLAPNVGDAEARKKAAIKTIDSLLAVHDDDEEAWYYRAQLAGGAGLFGGEVSAVPYYKALLQVNPLHPGANHELLHFYENFRRPALGWVYAENFIKSSPGIPHPFHMQAHLATRLGRWDKTSDRSARAIELERAYHKEMNVKPQEDSQFSHHLEILTTSLTHDGRYQEAKAIKSEAEAAGCQQWLPWFRLCLAAREWDEAARIVEHFRKNDNQLASYLSALAHLRQGQASLATPEIETLQQLYQRNRADQQLELRLWEVQGLWMCQTGAAEGGLKLLRRAVDRLKNDYSHHSWGNGAYYMESWGIAALQAGKLEEAEEAFLEALAHDSGSARAALGLHVLCEKLGRTQEALRYAELARRFWSKADSQQLEQELWWIRGENVTPSTRNTPANPAGEGGR
jgi:Tfp pilus assembly protein PilF